MSAPAEGVLLTGLRLIDHRGPLYRNLRRDPDSEAAEDGLFDDLSDHPRERAAAVRLLRPAPWTDDTLRAPFQRAERLRRLGWPARPWMGSRFSVGRHGVWYGALEVETTVRETAFHWVADFLGDAGFAREGLVAHRRVLEVECRAGLLDLRPAHRHRAAWLHPTELQAAQALGHRLHHEGHPGLLWPSVRAVGGHCTGIFNPRVLSNPRPHTDLRYRLSAGQVLVEPLSAPSSSAHASAKTPAAPR